MRAVIQRVSRSRVSVSGEIVGEIGAGLLVLLGVGRRDDQRDADYVLQKTIGLRVFDDADGKMNLTVGDIGGGLLVISQFTLYGDVRRGRRPSFAAAADVREAEKLYEYFVEQARTSIDNVACGRFQAMMDVELVNCGPVTIIIDSEKQF